MSQSLETGIVVAILQLAIIGYSESAFCQEVVVPNKLSTDAESAVERIRAEDFSCIESSIHRNRQELSTTLTTPIDTSVASERARFDAIPALCKTMSDWTGFLSGEMRSKSKLVELNLVTSIYNDSDFRNWGSFGQDVFGIVGPGLALMALAQPNRAQILGLNVSSQQFAIAGASVSAVGSLSGLLFGGANASQVNMKMEAISISRSAYDDMSRIHATMDLIATDGATIHDEANRLLKDYSDHASLVASGPDLQAPLMHGDVDTLRGLNTRTKKFLSSYLDPMREVKAASDSYRQKIKTASVNFSPEVKKQAAEWSEKLEKVSNDIDEYLISQSEYINGFISEQLKIDVLDAPGK